MDYMLERKMPPWLGAFPWNGVEVKGKLSAIRLQSLPSAKRIAKECIREDNARYAWIMNTRGDRLFITAKTR